MRVLDLFAGLGGWSNVARERGHEVRTLDNDPRFGCDYTMDILRVTPATFGDWRPDIILASPPCEAFSVAAFGKNWHPGFVPTIKAAHALNLVNQTRYLIEAMVPSFWVIENPRGLLRKMEVMDYLERVTVWYCRYGEPRAKPTDLWGGFPQSWRPQPQCHNGNPDHNAAPRGSRTGTQGFGTYAERSLIPRALALSIIEAAERDLSQP